MLLMPVITILLVGVLLQAAEQTQPFNPWTVLLSLATVVISSLAAVVISKDKSYKMLQDKFVTMVEADKKATAELQEKNFEKLTMLSVETNKVISQNTVATDALVDAVNQLKDKIK